MNESIRPVGSRSSTKEKARVGNGTNANFNISSQNGRRKVPKATTSSGTGQSGPRPLGHVEPGSPPQHRPPPSSPDITIRLHASFTFLPGAIFVPWRTGQAGLIPNLSLVGKYIGVCISIAFFVLTVRLFLFFATIVAAIYLGSTNLIAILYLATKVCGKRFQKGKDGEEDQGQRKTNIELTSLSDPP